MSAPVLIAYATRFDSTREIAGAVATTLRECGLEVDIQPVQEVHTLDSYQAVLIGSAVNNGSWLTEAIDFVKTNQQALNRIPVALFTVHITNLGNDKKSQRNRLAYLNAIRPLLQPVAEVFFAGRFDRHSAALLLPGWLARFIPTLDFRKWKKIRAWADNLAADLQL